MRFDDRRGGPNTGTKKRAVRDIVGVDEPVIESWSKRHRAIDTRRRTLAAAFQADHGRPLTDGEAITLAEHPWEQTRQAKHAPRAEAEERAAWLAEATAIVGTERDVRNMVAGCLGRQPRVQDIHDLRACIQ